MQIIKSTFICFSLIALWQLATFYFAIPDYLLPSPALVSHALWNQADLIFKHSLPTMLEIGLGFIFGIVFGCLAGGTIAISRTAYAWLLPLLIVSQAIPTFAIAPLIIIWLGYGLGSKIVIGILMIFFPVASAFFDGLKKTPQSWVDVATSQGASKRQIFMKIRIPASLPDLAAGIRIAAVIAPIGAIVGEWIGSSQGLGYLMITANARLQIDLMLAALLIIMGLSLLLYFSTDYLLKKLIWWV